MATIKFDLESMSPQEMAALFVLVTLRERSVVNLRSMRLSAAILSILSTRVGDEVRYGKLFADVVNDMTDAIGSVSSRGLR